MQDSPVINTAIQSKVKNELIRHLYPSLSTTIPLLVAVAAMLVFKMNGHVSQISLFLWLTAFLIVTAGQGVLAAWFKKTKDMQQWDDIYFKLLIVDVGLIGFLWGMAGVLFMPEDTIGQSYLIFILTFVAGGGSIYLAGSYLASAVYATGVLVPLVSSLIFSFFSQTHHEIYTNIILGLVGYWSILLIVSYANSKLFIENFKHNLINQALEEDLLETTEELRKMNSVSEDELISYVKNDLYDKNNHKIEHTDIVTGVDTQEVLEIRFFQSRAYARRHHQSLAILLINLNNFHEIKNKMGEEVSTLLLKTLAIRLQYCKRETDILSRLDENKFILVVSEVLLGNEVISVINKIQKILAEKTLLNDKSVNINANIGISMYPKDGNEISDLIVKSNLALAYLSQQGKAENLQYQIYDSEIAKTNLANISTHLP